ncbi:MAG: UDP-N-acetylmuramoyl-tripeptide--D-alanyl-D-alanine ligase [Thermoanaerobaculia bacterium]|nr:UDP-N-acetylmuramoyl-tripeptide--D-alanyl-D-alanine ligase [Thermoanaerobaculia bacterium]
MATRTTTDAARWMDGRVVRGDASTLWTGGALDSRLVEGGELFFAIPGETTDGHRFVGDALDGGAAAAVIHREVDAPGDAPLVRVEDTSEGLRALARGLREEIPEHLLALTGSVGKTTTKEILARLLSRRFRVAKSPGNLNTLYGFPLALMGIPEDTQWMVAEMGMSTAGELGALSRLGRPDLALLLNVRPVHLESLATLEAVAEAKAEILEGLSQQGTLVANFGDPRVREIAGDHSGTTISFGMDTQDTDYEAREVEARDGGGSWFRLRTPDGEIEIELPLHGLYNAENFLAAAACAHHLGVPRDELAVGALDLVTCSGRGEVHSLPGGIHVVDDSYNSNPVALERALDSARLLPGERHLAVLGEMLELGADGPRFHREAGVAAASRGFSPVVGVGELARYLVEAAKEAGADARWAADAREAAAWVSARIAPGDAILVKGSRGVGLEAVVDSILTRTREAE